MLVEKYDRPCRLWDNAEFLARLSPRERECLMLRAGGVPVLKIPVIMDIQWRTVWGYRIGAWRKYQAFEAELSERRAAKWQSRSLTG